MYAAPGEQSQAAFDEVKKIAYKNLLYSQVLPEKYEIKQRKIATELKPRDKTYVWKCYDTGLKPGF